MCDAGLALAVVGTGLNYLAGQEQRNAQAQAAKYNAQLLLDNAEMAEVQAGQIEEVGAQQVGRVRRAAGSLVGEQVATFGASGVKVGTGSPSAIAQETIKAGEQDAMTIRRNTAQEVWKYKKEAENLRERAELTLRSGKSSGIGNVGSLLTGVGQLQLQYGQPSASSGYAQQGGY